MVRQVILQFEDMMDLYNFRQSILLFIIWFIINCTSNPSHPYNAPFFNLSLYDVTTQSMIGMNYVWTHWTCNITFYCVTFIIFIICRVNMLTVKCTSNVRFYYSNPTIIHVAVLISNPASFQTHHCLRMLTSEQIFRQRLLNASSLSRRTPESGMDDWPIIWLPTSFNGTTKAWFSLIATSNS